MENKYTAVLVDISSIQQYIFNSNKLKLNIGASFIIENEVFGSALKDSIQKAAGYKIDLTMWATSPEKELTEQVEIGYIGGGNALILFKLEDNAKKFVQEYSKSLLLHYPGLKPDFAIRSVISFSNESFQEEMNDLQDLLRKNKQSAFRLTVLPKTGITTDCKLTGEVEEFPDDYDDYLISSVAKAKYVAFRRATEFYDKFFEECLNDKFQFPTDFDDIGIDKDKGYIAVVHLDGNDMGKKFLTCKSLPSFRRLSAEVKKISKEIMKEMVQHVVELFSNDQNDLNSIITLKTEKNNIYLPFRPIISGGDDFTFVCEGRLGLYLAEWLMKQFATKTFGNEKLSSCAGVAIVKAKYPFSRSYNLCEQIVKEAKKVAKSKTKGKNALHFLIAGSGFLSDDYKQIIQQQLSVPGKKTLINGPYFIDAEENNIRSLKSQIYKIRYGNKNQKWPMSKLKELRNILRGTESEQEYFIQTLKSRGLEIKDITGFKDNGLWSAKDTTPLYDIVELINFYPKTLL